MAIVAVKQIIIIQKGGPCLLLKHLEGSSKGTFNKLGMKAGYFPVIFDCVKVKNRL
jgi:hypothetical protein